MAAPTLRRMMQALIASPSVSSVQPALDMPNRALIEMLAGWLEDEGFTVEVLPLPEQPGKANLLASSARGPGGLVLCGHTDTVPCDAARWKHDPFRLSESGQRLYGLGTSDMKLFLALAIEAARSDAGAGRRVAAARTV